MCRVRVGLVGDGQSNALASVFMAFLDGEPVCAVGRSRVLKDPSSVCAPCSLFLIP